MLELFNIFDMKKVLLASFFLIALFIFLKQDSFATTQNASILAQSGRRQCGQRCGLRYGGCATGLKCMYSSRSGSYVCVYQAPGQTCNGRNPCCNLIPIPTAPSTNVTGVIARPSVVVPTGVYDCSMCDVDGNGVVDQNDINILQQKAASDANIQPLVLFCTNQCMGSGLTVTPPQTTPPPTGQIGDCASSQGPGIKDGKVDLLDIDQLRNEINQQSQTLFCDFDGNSVVDIFDFNDLRKVFVSQSKI
ncbi:hypothetical protein A3H80_01440 [Candidatus Roizmanbacteria bacterium RIFCSPLOWO2_02_FULL_37_19]|uniref:EF-hand domain-containing protein n=1 Tax=Candidatus Roizmanbacteria bacterium RIFCSPHIGHO2_02_FULL_37_24 TaxID=1802037 RepID=A0A1F7GVK6_9BACT|nr:MAG: hypothetical protein A2862_01460 [Candidatus Roizmanbacteria bacterium RIFCSPHIGHO2_01_FULL_38_41]OGK22998.1 MAG: hypothetical protein A3C24_02565 [Candidatus Roizmanbacteria bacterium RIFCSPHIGHO2_02_FULL_37_24]OGK32221.1 MAG: hypothetical protein A3E10_02160 [Candidatus Roizmanbacteria bacterium RIFCSPHIGHO2_12_FULL_37_23]OGK53854.1 MAG: hypothetical protein A3H80_01440 [Candidatus Roizmanbacteria bacterium RIFCSPLOWO2_02_FULL_37_19]OGK61323.1 MAG: hypothetical protein A3G65_00340 [Ca